MRVALFSSGFIDYSIQLANALSDRQNEVLLIMPNFGISDHISFLRPNIHKYIYYQPRFYSPRNIILLCKLMVKIIYFNSEIIHIQGGNLWFSLAMPFFYMIKSIVTTQHDVEPHIGEDHIWTRFMNYCGRNFSHRVIVHGFRLKVLLIDKYGLDPKIIHVIPLGEHNVAPFLKYAKNDIKDENNFVLFFGRIHEYKGLKYLIEAEPLIVREVPGVKIVIAGQGENFEKYEKLIKNKNNFLIYNHYISYEEGADLFQRSSIVVLPYIDASQSGVVSTAYGFRKPVIATDVGSIPEIVDNGITGFIIPPKNSFALAKAIIVLLKDKDLRKRMGENGYKKLKTDMSWSDISKKTIQVYNEAYRHG